MNIFFNKKFYRNIVSKFIVKDRATPPWKILQANDIKVCVHAFMHTFDTSLFTGSATTYR